MKPQDALQMAAQLAQRAGLDGWSVELMCSRYKLGLCNDAARVIKLSRWHCRTHSFDQVLNTVMHEIAHALVGCCHGHNAVWQAKAVELGAVPSAIAEDISYYPKWVAVCDGCGRTYRARRLPRHGAYCPCKQAAHRALGWRQEENR